MNATISLIERLSTARVLVIGDVMLDHYLWGDVYRISPEAPVPVVHANRDTYSAGGAANVALNLSNLGVNTSIIGYFAKDEAGQRLVEILKKSDVNVIETEQLSDAPTIIKTRVIIRNQQLCRIDREVTKDLYQIDSSNGFEIRLDDILNNVDAVIISDYAKGVITQSLIERVLTKAKSKPTLLVAVDPKPSRKLSFNRAGLLTPNRNEALELAGLTQGHPDEKYPLEEVCSRICDIYSPELLVITLGAEGMAICKDGQVLQHLPTVAREVFDVSGAGDTVIATLTASLVSGANPKEAAVLANGAAGCVVAHMGTVPVQKKELINWFSDHDSEQ